jgi:hypothetical protein
MFATVERSSILKSQTGGLAGPLGSIISTRKRQTNTTWHAIKALVMEEGQECDWFHYCVTLNHVAYCDMGCRYPMPDGLE